MGGSVVMSDYEISADTQYKHQKQFENHSIQYENALNDLQLVLIIDRSGSMKMEDEDGSGRCKSKGMINSEYWTRWDNAYQIVSYISDTIFRYDKDGEIPVIFFGDSAKQTKVRSSQELFDQFESNIPNNETTNMLAALHTAFSENISNPAENTIFIVVTDGSPNDGQETKIKGLIYDQVSRRDPSGEKLNVLFLRVGDDEGAIRFLQDMDDCVRIGENVDTKSDNEAYELGPKNLILNGIFEHLEDKKCINFESSDGIGQIIDNAISIVKIYFRNNPLTESQCIIIGFAFLCLILLFR